MTLEEFLSKPARWPKNAYVDEAGFKALYVRLSQRYVGGRIYPSIDIANVEAEKPGSGVFTALIERLAGEYPHLGIFVESVLNERFRSKLLRLGFQYVGPSRLSPNYFMYPAGDAYGPINIARLTRKYIRRHLAHTEYARLYPLQTRVDEKDAKHRLDIWYGVQSKNFRWNDLTQEEKDEVKAVIETEGKNAKED